MRALLVIALLLILAIAKLIFGSREIIPASIPMSLVIPFANHQQELVLERLEKHWPMPCKRYRAKSLVFYFNNNIKNNLALQRRLRLLSQKYSDCFESVKFHSAFLSGDRDKYPHGASHMFFRLFNPVPFPLRDVKLFYYMEPDNIPCRAGWLDQLLIEASHSSPLWMRGSIIRDGNPANGLASFAPHINGNSFYSLDRQFTSWLGRVEEQFWRNCSLYLDSYDIALYLMRMDREFYGFDEFAETAHLFQYTDTVVNFYRTPVSAFELCKNRPGTWLVHGRGVQPF